MDGRLFLTCALGLIGCGFHVGASAGDAHASDGALDDATSDAALDAAPPLGPWSTPVLVPLPNSAGGDDDPTLTADRLEMYFNRLSDIYVTRRASTSAGWGTPTVVAELSTAYDETTPEITSDGLVMLFASNRPGGVGNEDVWMSTRPDRTAAWGEPVNVSSASSTASDSAPTETDDQLAMVLNSTRGGGYANLYLTTRASLGAPWGTPVALTPLETPSSEYSPILSQDKLQIYFDSDAGGNEDLYTATRPTTSAAFGGRVKITELDTPSIEANPWVSADGHHIMFVSDRDTGIFAMYEATR